jgi:hypothetical protein
MGRHRGVVRAAYVAGGVVAVLLGNMALYRHDMHLDLTREKAFTPSPDTARILKALDQPVSLTYFYQKQDPAARAVRTMVDLMSKMTPNLTVRILDPDQNPGEANRLGVRLYNTAVLTGGGRREDVMTTDDREIALGILRLLRVDPRTVCFVSGHGEYDIDNFEFHTHFEGAGGHSHDIQGGAVVQMEQHGLGRLRRSLEKLGYGVRTLALTGDRLVPEVCGALIDANPRSRHGPGEAARLRDFLARGGGFMLLAEPEYEIDPDMAALLARSGVRFGAGVVVDPVDHYFTDEQMVAITLYARHPVTERLSLSIFPGVRPVVPEAAEGVASTALFHSGSASHVISDGVEIGLPGPNPIAVASEGRMAPDAKPFRLVAVGDADFASNSFFPYLSNADLMLGMIAWLMRDEQLPAMKPPMEVLPIVTLSSERVRGIFLTTVVLMPGGLMLAGVAVWWRRRR